MRQSLLSLVAAAVVATACAGSSSESVGGGQPADAVDVEETSTNEPEPIPVPVSEIQRELMTEQPGRLPVTFRHDAPDARVVRIEFTANYWHSNPAETIELLRVDDGTSSHAVTLYLGTDQWLYRYRVDGRWVTDEFAAQNVGAENGNFNSLLRVGDPLPGSRPTLGDGAGSVETIEIDSGILGRSVPYVLYTPPGDRTDPLPVLVLLHGFGQPATDWTQAVGIGNFMDNLLGAGRIEPFAIVMPSGANSNYTGNRALHIVDEVIPDARQRLGLTGDAVGADAQMAIGGFSQGGAGALRLTALRPDAFGLTMPIAMAGPCGGRCDNSLYAATFPDGFASTVVMWVGVDDELGLDVEHDRFAEYAQEVGLEIEDRRVDSDGHRLSGHSIRFVRTIAPDLLTRASEFFSG